MIRKGDRALVWKVCGTNFGGCKKIGDHRVAQIFSLSRVLPHQNRMPLALSPRPDYRQRNMSNGQQAKDTALGSNPKSKRPSHLRRRPLAEIQVPISNLGITPTPLQLGKANVQVPKRAGH